MSTHIPDDRFYSREHEWVLEEDNGMAVIGITDHAQSELGDVVFVELPELGTGVSVGEPIATVESVKAASEVYTPVSGEVIEVNEELCNTPGAVNADPYGDGWICKIRLSAPNELDALMSPGDYEEFCS